MPIARHICTSLGAPAQPLEPINSDILRPCRPCDRDPGENGGAVLPRASGVPVAASAASMRNALRLPAMLVTRVIRLATTMG